MQHLCTRTPHACPALEHKVPVVAGILSGGWPRIGRRPKIAGAETRGTASTHRPTNTEGKAQQPRERHDAELGSILVSITLAQHRSGRMSPIDSCFSPQFGRPDPCATASPHRLTPAPPRGPQSNGSRTALQCNGYDRDRTKRRRCWNQHRRPRAGSRSAFTARTEQQSSTPHAPRVRPTILRI